MKALIAEADFFSSPLVVWVEEGDSAFLPGVSEIREGLEVREGLKDVWGGF